MQIRAFLIIFGLFFGGVLAGFGQDKFSETDASKILKQVKSGIEARNERRVLSAFDGEKMEGYLQFQDQVRAFLRRYDPIRFYYRVTQTSAEDGKNVALVEVQMEADPADMSAPPVRRDQQVRVEFVGGKIVKWMPATFQF